MRAGDPGATLIVGGGVPTPSLTNLSCVEGDMKHPLFRIGLAGLAILLLTVSGCDTGTSPSGSPAGNVRSSTLSLGRTSVDASTLDAGDRVFFRSSDIEFWQIDSVADIAGIVSAKHRPEGAVDFALGHSLEYALGDAVESILFMASRTSL
jgi:hypothetical protein